MKPMIKILFYAQILLVCHLNTNAQISNNKERINEIKKWYAEIQSIGLKNCKSKKYIKTESLNQESPKFSFEQNIQVCQLNDLYQVTKCNLTGYEWSNDVIIYRRNDKVFFVLIKGTSEGYYYENRYYCDQFEKIIQQLDREGDGVAALKNSSKEIKTNIKTSIKVHLNDVFSEIEREFYKK
jgi:hypothetical protein